MKAAALQIDRRSFLLVSVAALATGRAAKSAEPTFIPLWPGTPPGGGGPLGPMEATAYGAVDSIAVPGLEMFAPERPNGAAVLVAAGGGYRRIMMELEARPAGRWLAARGITAFALVYRLPREGWADGRLAPLQDAQRALRLIRARPARAAAGRAAGLAPDPRTGGPRRARSGAARRARLLGRRLPDGARRDATGPALLCAGG